MAQPKNPGDVIRAAREAREWTNRDLAEEMGVIERTVQRWQAGDLPKLSTMRELADVLEIPLADLVGSTNGHDPFARLEKKVDALTRRVAKLERGQR